MINKEPNLEAIAEDPLAVFDEVNRNVWKDRDDPQIVTFIEKYRNKIMAEPVRSVQYTIVYAYMCMLKYGGSSQISDH